MHLRVRGLPPSPARFAIILYNSRVPLPHQKKQIKDQSVLHHRDINLPA